MDKMVPPKKSPYKLVEQKGQKSKILIALLKGKENATTLSRKLKHKAKKTPYVARYMQDLRKNFLLDEDPIEREDQKGNFTKNRGEKLNLTLFFIGHASEMSNVSFEKKEILFLDGLCQIIEKDRENLTIECIWDNDGLIFTTLLIKIIEILLDKENLNLLNKFPGLYKKCYVLARNQSFSNRLYRLLIDLEPLVYNFYQGDIDFENYVNKYVHSINKGVCVQNKDRDIQEFCDSLISIEKFEMKDGYCVRMIKNASKEEFDFHLKQVYEHLRKIKQKMGKKKFREYLNKIDKNYPFNKEQLKFRGIVWKKFVRKNLLDYDQMVILEKKQLKKKAESVINKMKQLKRQKDKAWATKKCLKLNIDFYKWWMENLLLIRPTSS